jgi:hypothetical protein
MPILQVRSPKFKHQSYETETDRQIERERKREREKKKKHKSQTRGLAGLGSRPVRTGSWLSGTITQELAGFLVEQGIRLLRN